MGFLRPHPTPRYLGIFGQQEVILKERSNRFEWPKKEKMIEMYPYKEKLYVKRIDYSIGRYHELIAI